MLALLALACIAAAPITDVRNTNDPARRIDAVATIDADDIALSGELFLTLRVDGPGPLTVVAGKPVVRPDHTWRIRELGLPTREVNGNRETWTMRYRLSPLVPGTPELAPNAVTVNGATIDWKNASWKITVTTELKDATVDSLRPITGVEDPPPSPVVPTRSPWRFAVVPGLLAVAFAAWLLGRRKRRPVVVHDADWAKRELAQAASPDAVASVVRRHLSHVHGIDAVTRTTAEIAATIPVAWAALLNDCDTARFSGVPATDDLASRATGLVGACEPEASVKQPVPSQSLRA